MKNLGKMAVFAGIGIELLVLVGAFLYAGRKIDEHFEWPGFAMTFGGMAALVLWLVHIVAMLKKMEQSK